MAGCVNSRLSVSLLLLFLLNNLTFAKSDTPYCDQVFKSARLNLKSYDRPTTYSVQADEILKAKLKELVSPGFVCRYDFDRPLRIQLERKVRIANVLVSERAGMRGAIQMSLTNQVANDEYQTLNSTNVQIRSLKETLGRPTSAANRNFLLFDFAASQSAGGLSQNVMTGFLFDGLEFASSEVAYFHVDLLNSVGKHNELLNPWLIVKEYHPSEIKKNVCHPPGVLSNQSIVAPLKKLYQENETVAYYCKREYVLESDWNTRTCRNGRWTHSPPLCRKRQASSLRELPKAECPPLDSYYGMPDEYADNIHSNLNELIRQTPCRDGYRLVNTTKNNALVQCSNNEQWIGNFPECEMIICKIPPPIENGRWRYSRADLYHEVDYSCNDGYQLSNETASRVRCENGDWPMSLKCQIIVCALPPAMANGSWSYKHEKLYHVIKFKCNDGYVAVDENGLPWSNNTIMECKKGKWIGEVPKCEPTSAENRLSDEEQTDTARFSNVTIVVIVSVAVGVIALSMAGLGALFYSRDRRRKQKMSDRKEMDKVVLNNRTSNRLLPSVPPENQPSTTFNDVSNKEHIYEDPIYSQVIKDRSKPMPSSPTNTKQQEGSGNGADVNLFVSLLPNNVALDDASCCPSQISSHLNANETRGDACYAEPWYLTPKKHK